MPALVIRIVIHVALNAASHIIAVHYQRALEANDARKQPRSFF